MKKFEILYNPYTNRIHFRQAVVSNESQDLEWAEIESDSSFLKYQGRRCIFENCVEEILDLINKFINTTGNLEIDFIGTDEDFGVLRTAVLRDKNPKSMGIVCECVERYLSSADALKTIKDAYEQIKTEFDDYIDNSSMDEDDERAEIGRTNVKFRDTVKAEIPVCVIGNYSVGKSALVNSLIGREILPSHANSTTAKNVLIENGDVYSIIFEHSDVHYNLEIEGSDIKKTCDGEIDEELISALIAGTEGMDKAEQILHQMIENLNKEITEDNKLAGIESNVRVVVPFRESELDTEKYSFVFHIRRKYLFPMKKQ